MVKSSFTGRHKRLCALLRKSRLDAGLRQIDLARKLRQPQSFVSKYENGERSLDLVELQRVCEGLGVTLTDFVRLYEKEAE